jgi:DNA gyrase/topoisomerase IV subunit A
MHLRNAIVDSYAEYAKFVQSRALPYYRDGLKIVQRRLLCTANEVCRSKFTKSASLCGFTIARYHPHSTDAVYGTLVNMINSPYSLFEKQGQFGGMGLQAAAMRYTQARLSELGRSFMELMEYVPKVEAESGVAREPIFIPTMIPYALLSGTMGMAVGVGTSTTIPPFTYESLRKYLKFLIDGGNEPEVKLWVDGDVDADMHKLTYTGEGKVIYKPRITKFYDEVEGKEVFVVEGNSPFTDDWSSKVENSLKDELTQGQVFIRNESTDKLRLIVGRDKNVRKITDDKLYKLLKSRLKRSISIKMNWNTETGPRVMGVREVLEYALATWTTFETVKVFDDVRKLELEVDFESHKKEIGNSLIKGNEGKLLKSYSKELIDSAKRRSMSSYLEDVDMTTINSELRELSLRKSDVFRGVL